MTFEEALQIYKSKFDVAENKFKVCLIIGNKSEVETAMDRLIECADAMQIIRALRDTYT